MLPNLLALYNLKQASYLRNCMFLGLPKSKNQQISNNPEYTNFLNNEFKSNFKNHRIVRSEQRINQLKPLATTNYVSEIKLIRSFKSFLRLNGDSFSTLTIPHFSFKVFYLGYSRGGLSTLNLTRLFGRWKDIYYLVFNLFFYKIDLLTFGSSFFKNELLSMNWQVMGKFKFMWRYTRPFLTLKSNKITTYGDFVFTRLSLLGMRISLVIDVLYHTKTIYYLHRSGFYTIGLVPLNHNINTLNFAIPSGSDSLLSQVFFIRFISLIKQNTLEYRHTSMKKLWFKS